MTPHEMAGARSSSCPWARACLVARSDWLISKVIDVSPLWSLMLSADQYRKIYRHIGGIQDDSDHQVKDFFLELRWRKSTVKRVTKRLMDVQGEDTRKLQTLLIYTS